MKTENKIIHTNKNITNCFICNSRNIYFFGPGNKDEIEEDYFFPGGPNKAECENCKTFYRFGPHTGKLAYLEISTNNASLIFIVDKPFEFNIYKLKEITIYQLPFSKLKNFCNSSVVMNEKYFNDYVSKIILLI